MQRMLCAITKRVLKPATITTTRKTGGCDLKTVLGLIFNHLCIPIHFI